MKFEYVFMGYIIIVIGRLYFSVIHDEVRKWRAESGRKNTSRNARTPLTYRP